MGKNKNKESLIGLIVNTVVHEIVVKHTNRPESKNFLASEIVEYRSKSEKSAKKHAWNEQDKNDIREKALKKIKERLASKYPDVQFLEKEASDFLDANLEVILK